MGTLQQRVVPQQRTCKSSAPRAIDLGGVGSTRCRHTHTHTCSSVVRTHQCGAVCARAHTHTHTNTHTHAPVRAAVLQAVPLALGVPEHHQAQAQQVHLRTSNRVAMLRASRTRCTRLASPPCRGLETAAGPCHGSKLSCAPLSGLSASGAPPATTPPFGPQHPFRHGLGQRSHPHAPPTTTSSLKLRGGCEVR